MCKFELKEFGEQLRHEVNRGNIYADPSCECKDIVIKENAGLCVEITIAFALLKKNVNTYIKSKMIQGN